MKNIWSIRTNIYICVIYKWGGGGSEDDDCKKYLTECNELTNNLTNELEDLTIYNDEQKELNNKCNNEKKTMDESYKKELDNLTEINKQQKKKIMI